MGKKYSWQQWNPADDKEKTTSTNNYSWQGWKPDIKPLIPNSLESLIDKSPDEVIKEEKVNNNKKYSRKEIPENPLKGLLKYTPISTQNETPKRETKPLPTFNPAQQKVYEEAGEVVPNKHVDAYSPIRNILSSYDNKAVELYKEIQDGTAKTKKKRALLGDVTVYGYTKQQLAEVGKYEEALKSARNLVEKGKVDINILPEYMQKDIIGQMDSEKRTDAERLQKDKEYQEGIKNPLGRFLERTSRVASNTFLGGTPYNYVAPANGAGDVISDVAGTLIGYGTNIPGAGTSQLGIANNIVGQPVENAVSKLTSRLPQATPRLVNNAITKIAPMAARGAAEGAALGGIQGAAQGLDVKDIGNKMLVEGAAGAVLDPLMIGGSNAIGKIGKRIIDNIKVGKLEKLPMVEVASTVDDAINNKSTLINSKGKYKVKNIALDNAITEYNNAIETIQNYFKTNELRTDEMPKIKTDLGIDLDAIVKNIDDAEKGIDIRKVAERNRLSQVAGITEKPNLNFKRIVNDTTPNTPKLPTINQNSTSSVNTLPRLNKGLKEDLGVRKVAMSFDDMPSSNTTSKIYADMQPPKSQIVSSNKKEKLGFWDNMSKLYTRTVDSSNPIKKADLNTYVKATNAKSTGGIVDYVLKDGLVDPKGNKIGKSLREVVEEVPRGKENEFWDYMLHRNNIDRAREGKAVYPDFTPEMSSKVVKRFEASYPEYKAIGDDIVNWIDKFTRTWGVDAGTIDNEMYDSLKDTYKSYIPTNRDFSTLEDSIPQGVRSKFVDQKTPIKKATGSERDIVNPVENIMNLVNRTIRTAKYNEVGQTLLDSVRKSPEKMKQFAEEIATKDGMFSNTDNIITVLENGKPVYMQINNIDLLKSLEAVPKQINNIKYLSSAMNLYKGLITQKNPIFAIRNIFRDIPTAYVYGSENNPVKFGADLLKAGKEVATNGEMLQKYKSVGGGGANFFNSGNVTKSAKSLTKKESILLHPIKAIEKFNNLTETAPRLAEFTRVYEKTGDINKALYAANDVTVNFSRGGDITKALDKGVPYLNAGVQGFDKFFREAKNNPLKVIAKAGISITTPTIALYIINKDNPNYQQLDNRTKDTYYLIPDISSKDEQGNAKTFIKIPKSRELGVLFSALFERSARAVKGEDKAFKGFANTTATNFSPTNPVENNIFSPLAYNIPTNKDFADRPIVPLSMIMDNRSPYLQYDEKTSEIAKKIGDLTKNVNGGLSPKQIDYVMKSYLGIIAQYGLPLNTKGNDPLKALTTQFKADPIYSNQTLTDFYDNLDKLKRVAADKNITQKLSSKLVTPEERAKNMLNKASLDISDINKEIRKLDQVKDKAKIEELRRRILKIANDANSKVK